MQEENKFRIGEFTFDTFHEYRDGQEDLKKIECINNELDIHDPKVAVRLYNMIRTGEIVFKSPIGDKFYAHLADIVADKSVGLLEVKDDVEEAESKVKTDKIIGIAIIGLAIIFFAYFGVSELVDYIDTKKMAKLQEEKQEAEVNNSNTSSNSNLLPNVVDLASLTVLPEYEGMVAANPEFVGWIIVPDTQINYPVTQKAGDNDYYLSHAFDNSEDSAGSIFMDSRCDIVNPTVNTILYGHNMRNGSMFGQLNKYLEEDFYNNHKIITFDTKYQKQQYEIVAVCLSQVGYQDENNFKYYNYIGKPGDDAGFGAFVETVKNLSVYGKDINIDKSDKLLTLSTCNNYTEDGRLFVVAKKVN